MWKYHGQQRPSFAQSPDAGQESVWDYPRPPVLVEDNRRITIDWQGLRLLDTGFSFRVLETASPPTFYFPPDALLEDVLRPETGSSYCEWKGLARYWGLEHKDSVAAHVAWSYPQPKPDFTRIAGWLAFYPKDLECRIDGERVQTQEGGFYGGWVTSDIVGPWKGQNNTGAW